MCDFAKTLVLVAVLLYVISPIDAVPMLIDDVGLTGNGGSEASNCLRVIGAEFLRK